MRIRLLSDLHLEHSTCTPLAVECDVVVLAGDIDRGLGGIAFAQRSFPDRPVVLVAGNHEHYRYYTVRENTGTMRHTASGTNVHFLENETVVLDGVRFLGCTLWTDFALDGTVAASMESGASALNDFRLCRWIDKADRERVFTPQDSVLLHLESRSWLERELAKPFAGKTVVVTHHLPSRKCIHPIFYGSDINPCFASDLEALMGNVDVWVHGHTHSAVRASVGACRILCNPRGYSDRPETPDAAFDPVFTFGV